MHEFKVSKFLFLAFFFALLTGVLSANKPLNLLPDMSVYNEYYNDIISGLDVIVEPTYIFIAKISSCLGVGFPFVIFIYAIASITIKAYAIRYYNERNTIAILYLSSFFVLHELVQIRVGLAVSFLFLGCCFYFCGHKKRSLLFMLLASLFHVSAIIFPCVFYFSAYLSKAKFAYLAPSFVFVCLFLAVSGFFTSEYIAYVIPSVFQYKIEIYTEMQSYLQQDINLLSTRLVVFYLTILSLAMVNSRLDSSDRIIMLTVSIFLILMFVTSGLPSLAMRIIEICSPFFVILIARMHKYYPKLYTVPFVVVFFLSNIYYSLQIFSFEKL